MQEHNAAGTEYLQLITTLLQRARLADDEAGLWEAGDLQWWWRPWCEGNEPARLLYVGSGFQPRTRSETYQLAAAP